VGSEVGDAVGDAIVGIAVGPLEGSDDVGGCDATGGNVAGAPLGIEVTGLADGEAVGGFVLQQVSGQVMTTSAI
jgi:hypothetical protein